MDRIGSRLIGDESSLARVWTGALRWGLGILLVGLGALPSGEARAQFSSEKVITGPCSACEVDMARVADVDGDGDQDVVVGADFPYLGWFENTASGFADFERINDRSIFNPTKVSLADINTDDKPEIFTGLGWYVNQGGGMFSGEKTIDESGWRGTPLLADVNGDGLKDLFVRELTLQNVYLQNPSFDPGAFSKADPAPIFEYSTNLVNEALADFGGDAKIDVLTMGADTLGWVETGEVSNEDGLRDFSDLRLIEALDPNGNFEYRTAFANDLDGDGDPDVLAVLRKPGQPPSHKIVWYEHTDGAGTFSDRKLIQGESNKISKTALPFDVDADGDMDVVNFGGLALDRKGDSIVLQWYEYEGGSYTSPKTLGGVEEVGPLTSGDLSEDGRPDLLFPQEERGLVKWYPNNSDGTLGNQRAIGGEAPELVHPLLAKLRQKTSAVDIDQDGDEDLLAFDDRTYLTLLRNTGTGFADPDTLTNPVDPDVVPRAISFFERVDGDAYPDAIYTAEDTTLDANNEILGWAENDGTGSFTYNRFGEKVAGYGAQTTADVDGDGDWDLVSTVSGGNTIDVNEKDGGALRGGASNRIEISVKNGLRELSSADLDGDGDEDLIGNFWSFRGSTGDPAALVWYEDTGNNWDFGSGQDGLSTAKIIDENGSFPPSIEAVDVDSDGDLDLVNGSLRWYENLDGEGTFSEANSIDLYTPNVSYSYGLSRDLADVDGDGDPDVVLYEAPFGTSYQILAREGNDWYGRRNVRWHENRGGTFAKSKILIEDLERPKLRADARRPWVFDINGDEIPDVAYASGTISHLGFQKLAWFENTEAIAERRTMASGETASFGEAGIEVHLSGGTAGSGTVTVRRPFTGPVNTGSIDAPTVFRDRFVIEAGSGLTVGSGTEVRIAPSSIAGIEDPTNVTVYRRDTTDRGTLQALPTTYDAEAGSLVVTTDRFGEFVPATSTDQSPPDVPTGLTAQVGADSVSLTWRPSDSTDVTEYRIYRATAPIDSSAGPSERTALDTTAVGDTTYVDRSVQTGGLYYYRVTAVDDGLTPNESGFSAEGRAAVDRPQVVDVHPASGAPGTRVRIYGANFDEKSTVTFGSATAPIDRVTPTVLYVRVPEGTGGPTSVAVERGIATVEWAGRFTRLTGGGKTFAPIGAGLTGVGAPSTSWGDFDGDGDQDLVITGNNSDGDPTATIYENEGGGTFAPLKAGLTGVESGEADWGDYNGDGRLDLVVVGKDANYNATATIYENRGGGTFEPVGAGLTGVEKPSAAWGDVDADSDQDLAVTGKTGDGTPTATIYENKGEGTFEPLKANLTGVEGGEVDWGDYTGDGRLDLVVTGGGPNGNPTATIYENKGGGSFDPLGAGLNGVYGGAVDGADFDGDGDRDLVVTGEDANFNETKTIYENRGGGSFDPLGADLTDGGLGSADWGDVDGDGDVDLLLPAAIYENEGNGVFGQLFADLPFLSSGSSAWGDYDGDGDLDLVLTGADFPPLAEIYENRIPPAATSTKTVSSDGTKAFGGTGTAIAFSGVGGSGDVTVRLYDEAPRDTSGIGKQNVSTHRVTIETGLSFNSAEVRLAVSLFSGIDDPKNVTIYKRPSAGSGTFEALTTSVDENGTSGDISDDTLSASVGSFSEFVLASGTEPLPVELAGFEATLAGEAVRLTWQTASERGNAGFRIQRRAGAKEGGNWETIGRKQGAGTTTKTQSYRYTDANLPYAADRLTYRLKQVDTDGTTHVSRTVTVKRGVDEVQLLGTYPNPARSRATVRYALPEKQDVTIRLYDVLGRQVRTVVQAKQKGRHERRLDTSGLPSGVYFLRLTAGGQTRTQKLTVVR